MKVLAPIASHDELEMLAAAGAEELYCGIVPREWSASAASLSRSGEVLNENRYRPRALYALYILLVVCLGLVSRSKQAPMPHLVRAYAGDILWATAAFLFIGFLSPKMTTWRAAICATVFSGLIELSQLYHTPWLDGLRRTRVGALVLGRGFLWSDLGCYAVGVMCGVCVELITSRFSRRQ